ncbi:uncharacterized protein B0T15DRAFT_539630 [Chaetomium strumarium]|uniref:Uncharacterized protein n=1 Tax=Chaetomium strumarium TaxID=1170767 RepID=A0AAJ0GNL2_9PEZI|nr:hypothetical protein B0T15DRAFT_539630 [Chaetomium strumarium]
MCIASKFHFPVQGDAIMVTTRRGSRPADDDSSSGDDSDIPAHPVGRRGPAAPTSATLRPPIEAAGSSNRAKGKRKATVPDTPQKRPRHTSDIVKESIEVQLEDDNVDAVINVTDARHRRIEIPLPTRKGLWGEEGKRRNNPSIAAMAPSEPSIVGVRAPRPRAKRINRQTKSVEVVDELLTSQVSRRKAGKPLLEAMAETPRHGRLLPPAQYESQGAGKEDDELPGSPELQSSAVKLSPRRRASGMDDTLVGEEAQVRRYNPKTRPSAPKPAPRRLVRGMDNALVDEEAASRRHNPKRGALAPKRRPKKPMVDIYEVPDDEEELEPGRLSPELQFSAPEHLSRRAAADLHNVPRDDDSQQLPKPANTRRPSIAVEEAVAFAGSEEPEELDGFGDQEDMAEVGERDELDMDSGSVDEIQGSVGVNIVIRRFTAKRHAIRTMRIRSYHINNMLRIMGASGWTRAGRRWGVELIQANLFNFDYVSPALTRLAKNIFNALGLLKDLLDDIPNALDLANQSQFLEGQEQAVNEAMRRVDGVVSKIKSLKAPPALNPERRRQNLARFNQAVTKGLCSYVIPMFVLLLQSCFAVGIEQPDAEADTPLPEEGVFTGVTAQLMLWVSKWLLRLYRSLARQFKGPEAEEGQGPGDAAQNRESFGVMLRKWDEHLRHAVAAYNEQIDRERDICEKKRRDEEAAEAKRKKEEEELARVRENEEVWKRSLLDAAGQPRPLAEAWHKTTQHWPASQTGDNSSTPKPRPQSHTLSRLRPSSSAISSGGQAAPQAAPQARANAGRMYPPWPEDETTWFLGELKQPRKPRDFLEICAQVLERPLWEVREEKERLKRLGRYRSPVR